PQQGLAQVRRAAIDVAARQVGVVSLQPGRRQDGPLQHDVPEPRRKTLQLRLDPVRDVAAESVRHVRVGPGGVGAARRSRRIEERWLGHEEEWRVRHAAGRYRALGSSDFLRSEEHTSELQSRENLVCRLLLEKKKNK